jgi:D-tyrosyl-tRNA(Tyr) deacylase
MLYMYYSNLKILTPSKYFENGGVQTIFISRHSTTVQYISLTAHVTLNLKITRCQAAVYLDIKNSIS